jgi:hypothetical protein
MTTSGADSNPAVPEQTTARGSVSLCGRADVDPTSDLTNSEVTGVESGPSDHADETNDESATTRRRLWPLGRMLVFSFFTLGLATESPGRLTSDIPGNPGDAYLVMSLLEWGGDRTTGLFRGYWDGPMYSGGTNVMAYTDTFLPLTVPFRLLEELTGSRVLAFNLLYLASWVLCAEATYRLALRLVSSRLAATIGALAFTFSTIRISQSEHFQLAWAGLIPLALLAYLVFRDQPSVGRGATLALVIVAQVLTSAYYGLILIVAISVLVLNDLDAAWRSDSPRRKLVPFGAYFATLGALMIPIRHWYASAQEQAVHRDGYLEQFVLRLGDLRSPAQRATFLRKVPVLDGNIVGRSSESYAYIGTLTLFLVPVFVVLLATRNCPEFTRSRRRDLIAISAVGLFALSIAVGRGPIFGIHMPFYDLWVRLIPGLDSVIAIVRLVVFTQLALVMASTVALAALLGRVRSRRVRLALGCLLALVVAVDGSTKHPMLEVVEPRSGSVAALMQELDAGVAVELPMAPTSLADGATAYLEATRMVLGTDDDIQTVNGYSGLAPLSYETTIALANQFPLPAAIDELDRLDVRYVVLHTAPVDTGLVGVNSLVNSTGYAFFDADQVGEILASLPEGLIVRKLTADDGIILELRDPDE